VQRYNFFLNIKTKKWKSNTIKERPQVVALLIVGVLVIPAKAGIPCFSRGLRVRFRVVARNAMTGILIFYQFLEVPIAVLPSIEGFLITA
jgi:hypothetical protein